MRDGVAARAAVVVVWCCVGLVFAGGGDAGAGVGRAVAVAVVVSVTITISVSVAVSVAEIAVDGVSAAVVPAGVRVVFGLAT